MLALVAALVLSADGGVSFEAPLYATCPAAPPNVQLDGGWKLMPPERDARLACLLATCEADRREARKPEAQAPSWVQSASSAVVAVAAVVGAVLAAARP